MITHKKVSLAFIAICVWRWRRFQHSMMLTGKIFWDATFLVFFRLGGCGDISPLWRSVIMWTFWIGAISVHCTWWTKDWKPNRNRWGVTQSEALEDTKSIRRIEIPVLCEAEAIQTREEGKTENVVRCWKRRRDSKRSADAICVSKSRLEARVSTERVSEKLTTFALRPGHGTRTRARHERNQGSNTSHWSGLVIGFFLLALP